MEASGEEARNNSGDMGGAEGVEVAGQEEVECSGGENVADSGVGCGECCFAYSTISASLRRRSETEQRFVVGREGVNGRGGVEAMIIVVSCGVGDGLVVVAL